MKINTKKSESGFILVTVMLLTMVGGTVVLTSLKDSTVQERLSGNFQKKMNSRLVAEKGVYSTLQKMQVELDNNEAMTIAELAAAFSGATGTGGDNSTYGIVVEENPENSNEVFVYSTGSTHEGNANLKAIYEKVSSSGSSSSFEFGNGVTGCESVTVTASGYIDSYDSSIGEYGEEIDGEINKGSEANVQTIYEGSGDINLSGAATIDGSILATGNISYINNTGYVTGEVHANGSVTLKGIPVDGNVTAGEMVTLTGERGVIGGYILANNDVTLTQVIVGEGVRTHANYYQTAGDIDGNVRVVGNVGLTTWGRTDLMDTASLIFAGTTNNSDSELSDYVDTANPLTAEEIAAAIGDVPLVPAEDANSDEVSEVTCDPYDIASQVAFVAPEVTEELPDLYISGYGSGNEYLLAEDEASFTVNNGDHSPEETLTPETVIFLSSAYTVYKYENVSIDGHLNVAENHDVTIYVRGDFTMGGSSSLNIPDGSSLTIIIEGEMTIAGGAVINTPVSGITNDANPKPVFVIYSAHDDRVTEDDSSNGNGNKNDTVEYGITFEGGTNEVHAVIYAPLTNVKVTAGVAFKGAIFGNQVNTAGAGSIHYDEALGKVTYNDNNGDAGAGTRLVFKGWEYFTEDDTTDVSEVTEPDESEQPAG